MLNDFLRKLTRQSRTYFIRRYWYGESIREIAELSLFCALMVAGKESLRLIPNVHPVTLLLLLATAELTLQLGDRLTVVGEAAAIQNVEKVLGNAVKSLKEPNLVAVFIGIVIGLALGAIPISIPGISAPVRLGLAGGPIIVGILIGTFGPRMHMVTYTTRSANLMLRALGLSLYLACLGLDAGAHFFDTVFRPEGLLWIATGFALTVVPVLIMGIVTFKWLKIDFGTMAGMLCGSMANPMALNYANDTIPGDNPSVAYATVYPLCMFLRVIIAQVLLMFFING